MQKDMMETMQKMTQTALDNLKQLSDTNMSIAKDLMQEQMDLTASILETTTKSTEDLAEAKNYGDLASGQAGAVQKLSKTIMESARTTSETISEAGNAYAKMLEAGMKEVSNTVTKATPKARKSA